MLTPAQAHFQRTMAQRAGLIDDSQSQTVRTAHEQILHRLRLAQARLKGIQSKAAKAELKKTLLPDFSGWIDGTLESDSGRQDEVIVTLMVWAVDCGDLPLALRIGEYVVRHNLSTPDSFGRDAATLLTEEICNPVLTLAGTDQTRICPDTSPRWIPSGKSSPTGICRTRFAPNSARRAPFPAVV